jgi:hypothetical protein
MRWPLTIIVLCLVLAVSLGLYRLESEVKVLERRLNAATNQLENNRRDSRILAAEWRFLSQPSRLQDLARRHLDLRDLTPAQIGHLATLPQKPLDQPLGQGGAGEAHGEGGQRPGAVPNLEGGGQPPLPGWKPTKPRRRGRIVLAEGGEGPQ